MSKEPVFKFGKNWESFSEIANEDNLLAARTSLQTFLGEGALKNKTFLDIGCGSGLFSIAAVQLGGKMVVGIDLDPISVETSQKNARKWIPGKLISFRPASVLSEEEMKGLGKFDIVYAWGVLHHTGNMDQAIHIASRLVKTGGKLAISIYNRHFTSPIWLIIKRQYNKLPLFGQRVACWILTPVIFMAKFLVTGRNPLRMNRGMEFMHNVIDWLGGYPYEYASIQEIEALITSIGFRIVKVIPAKIPTGCNEFLCQSGP